MKKTIVGLGALVSLGANLSNAKTHSIEPQSYSTQPKQGVEESFNAPKIDHISLMLTPQQRSDLYKILNEMGAEIGDWKTYSPEAAPSKCTISVD